MKDIASGLETGTKRATRGPPQAAKSMFMDGPGQSRPSRKHRQPVAATYSSSFQAMLRDVTEPIIPPAHT